MWCSKVQSSKIGLFSTFLCVAALLAACAQTDRPEAQRAVGDVIPGQYIVALQQPESDAESGAELDIQAQGAQVQSIQAQSVQAQSLELARVAASLGVQQVQTLGVINGFVAVGVDKAARLRLESDARVRYVEPDRIVKLSGTQGRPSWGLDRIDQRSLPLNHRYTYRATGRGVTAYVIDSGIREGSEFGSRLVGGVTAIDDGRGYDDCYGHGTHVAGTLGGKTYGVAKNVKLVAVRVFGCNGESSNSAVVGGISWVNFNHTGPAVANLSLESSGSTGSRAIDEAVEALVADNVTVVVAAGNEGSDACNVSPARVPEVLTVGASTRQDKLWSNSNRGRCVDVFAPGENITSAGLRGTLTMSGTSMASPHAAGVAALILEKNRGASPASVIRRLESQTTGGKLSNTAGAPNRLLHNNF